MVIASQDYNARLIIFYKKFVSELIVLFKNAYYSLFMDNKENGGDDKK